MLKTILGMWLCLPTIGLAQETSKVTLVSEFWEIVRPAAKISGARVVGFAAIGQLDENLDEIAITATVPGDWAGYQACLKVVSADGLYESQNTYAVSKEWDGGVVMLDYPSSELDLLKDLPKEMVAALLVRGDCTAVSTEASRVDWGRIDASFLRIMLNTSRADETYMYFPNNSDIADIVCDVAAFDGRNAFDTICTVPNDLVNSGKIEAVILSFKNGEMGREELIVLRF